MKTEEEILQHERNLAKAISEISLGDTELERRSGLDYKDYCEMCEVTLMKMFEDSKTEKPDLNKMRSKAIVVGIYALRGWTLWLNSQKVVPVKEKLLADVWTTLKKKNRDYGTKTLIKFGIWGMIIRTDSKIVRLQNLLETGNTPENEPVTDTWLDIIGYSTLIIMFCKGEIR